MITIKNVAEIQMGSTERRNLELMLMQCTDSVGLEYICIVVPREDGAHTALVIHKDVFFRTTGAAQAMWK